jgi:hypothetical protein
MQTTDVDLVVPTDVQAATLFEPYPTERYRAVREGRMTTEEFIEDLLRHVDESLARDRGAGIWAKKTH